MSDLEQKRELRRKSTAEFFTPHYLVNYMLDKLENEMWVENKTFCDPTSGNGNFLVEILKRKLKLGYTKEESLSTIYGVELMYDNVEEIKQRLLKIVGYKQKYINIINKNIICYNALTFDWSKFNFDLVISNPPYKNIDLKILKLIYNNANRIMFLHPATWLYDNKFKLNIFNECRELVKEHFIYYERVDNIKRLFNINIHIPIGISYISKLKSGIKDEIYNIDINGDSEIYKSIKRKIIDYCNKVDNFENHKIYNKNRNEVNVEYCIGISKMIGNINTNDFYSLIQKRNENKHLQSNSDYQIKFYFNTKIEQINCLNYLKLKFARFCLSIYKIKQEMNCGELASVPYFDFTKEWTNEKCVKELNITDKELEYIINKVPNYYKEDTK